MEIILIGLALIVILLGIAMFGLRGLLYNCAPNEVLIFAGRRRRDSNRTYGFRIIKGGSGLRVPFFEKVYRMDLTNMVIDITAQNAYSKGGIPLTVQGVANVKIAGHEPLLNNAIERFLGRNRTEVMQIAKATLEGSLRGILATMTPEQVNEDKIIFAERLVQEVEQDMTNLGLVVDTMKIQNVQDDVKYLESIGRRRNAEVVKNARIAEATARADSIVRQAENQQREAEAQIRAEIEVAKADAAKRLAEIQTRRAALVAEEQAQVQQLVAQAIADLEVQKARLEQIRLRLEADVVQPAKAAQEAADAQAKAQTATIIEDARARAEALRTLSAAWNAAGPSAREVLVAQKLEAIIGAVTNVIPETAIDKVTMIDSNSGGSLPAKALGTNEMLKQVFGIDLVEKVKAIGQPQPAPVIQPVIREVVEVPVEKTSEEPRPASPRFVAKKAE
jgi:flotillin